MSLIVTDLHGNTEMLTDYTELNRKRRVNGEHSLSFVIFATERNEHSYPLVEEESIVEYGGQQYRIKNKVERTVGNRKVKSVRATHIFFDLIEHYQYNSVSSTLTIEEAVFFALEGTGYTFQVEGLFTPIDIEIGQDNALSILNDVAERYEVEYQLDNKHIVVKKEIGRKTDIQFRYKHNVKTIEHTVDTSNLSTYIRGFGKQNDDGTHVVTAEYTSPNASIFGIKHAEPIRDSRYTNETSLLERLQRELIDEPEVSIKINVRLIEDYEKIELGDEIFLIHEVLGIDLKARIMDYDEWPEDDSKQDSVTIANFAPTVSDFFVDLARTKENVDKILEGSKKIPYAALDNAIQRATEAINNSMTELQYPVTGGIRAVDKTDPNKWVAYNSAGLGVTNDNGATYGEAITGDGINATYITVGTLDAQKANLVNVTASMITLGSATNYEPGYNPKEVEQNARNYTDSLTHTTSKVTDTVGIQPANHWVQLFASFGIVFKALKEVTLTSVEIPVRFGTGQTSVELARLSDDGLSIEEVIDSKTITLTEGNERYELNFNLLNDGKEYILYENYSKRSGSFSLSRNVGIEQQPQSEHIEFLRSESLNSLGSGNYINYWPYFYNWELSVNQKLVEKIDLIEQEVSDVSSSLSTLQDDFNNISFDGIVDEAEALALQSNIDILNNEKTDINSKYESIYNNTSLTTTAKNVLQVLKGNYDTAHSELITAINDAIADKVIDETDKQNVNTKFSNYRSRLSLLSDGFEQTIDTITQTKANKAESNANTYTDNNAVIKDANYNQTFITQDGVQVRDNADGNVVTLGEFLPNLYGLRAEHEDGTYTQLTKNGFERLIAGESKPYQYETYLQEGTTISPTGYGTEKRTKYTDPVPTYYTDGKYIQLPERFKGKNFKAFIVYRGGEMGHVGSVSSSNPVFKINSINYPSARIHVIAYNTSYWYRETNDTILYSYEDENVTFISSGAIRKTTGFDFTIIVTL